MTVFDRQLTTSEFLVMSVIGLEKKAGSCLFPSAQRAWNYCSILPGPSPFWVWPLAALLTGNIPALGKDSGTLTEMGMFSAICWYLKPVLYFTLSLIVGISQLNCDPNVH